jgi:hypothetical protein
VKYRLDLEAFMQSASDGVFFLLVVPLLIVALPFALLGRLFNAIERRVV